MGETDYWMIALVAVVGMVSIIGMHASTEGVALPNLSGAITGYVAATNMPTVTAGERSVVIVYPEGAHDFSRDGQLSSQDSVALDRLVREQECPLDLDCDVNNDGALDRADVAALNARILATRKPATLPRTEPERKGSPQPVKGLAGALA